MQMSARAKRMERHHRRHKGASELNLVSMMDIFTILVFFLLVSSVNVEVLPNPKDLKLPESIAEQRARENVVVMVTDREILVQGRPVATIAEVMARDDLAIPALEEALRSQSDRVLRKESMANIADREITIMGDRGLLVHLSLSSPRVSMHGCAARRPDEPSSADLRTTIFLPARRDGTGPDRAS